MRIVLFLGGTNAALFLVETHKGGASSQGAPPSWAMIVLIWMCGSAHPHLSPPIPLPHHPQANSLIRGPAAADGVFVPMANVPVRSKPLNMPGTHTRDVPEEPVSVADAAEELAMLRHTKGQAERLVLQEEVRALLLRGGTLGD